MEVALLRWRYDVVVFWLVSFIISQVKQYEEDKKKGVHRSLDAYLQGDGIKVKYFKINYCDTYKFTQ